MRIREETRLNDQYMYKEQIRKLKKENKYHKDAKAYVYYTL